MNRSMIGAFVLLAPVAQAQEPTGTGKPDMEKPNVIYVFADQWRGQEVGYMGNVNVRTPNIDRLAGESRIMTNMVSTCPVSGPHRASLLTGTYPLTNGVFYNDKPMAEGLCGMGDAFKAAGYNTAYIGKWHIDGHGRDSFIPKERRLGFDYWKVRECTHKYNDSFYYADTPDTLYWQGYDAIAQTEDAVNYIRRADRTKPYVLFLSWGPPHDPYDTAPEAYKKLYADRSGIKLRENVSEQDAFRARRMLSGYYAHIAALDDCMGRIMDALDATGQKENTILVFTSDHGDMLMSHGKVNKQQPFDESILVPFIMRYPKRFGTESRRLEIPMGTPDIMPTLLSLSGVRIPKTVEGKDRSDYLLTGKTPRDTSALIMCVVPFHQWNYARGGYEYRGLRTPRYTYVRTLQGPAMLFDNVADPYQQKNLIADDRYRDLAGKLDKELQQRLRKMNDRFLSGPEYMKMWNYTFDAGDEIKQTEK